MGSTISKLLLASFLIPGLCVAQAARTPIDTTGWTPPPLVEASDAPRPPPPSAPGLATPTPPGYDQPPPTVTTIPGTGMSYTSGVNGTPGAIPGSNPYSLGAYGEPPKGPEIGLMVSESLFGMLTSAGTALIPYYLLLKPLASGGGLGAAVDPGLVNLIFILTFSAVPLAISQTELSLANGSRYYLTESWPPALAGLLGQAAVVGAYYLLKPSMQDGGEAFLLIGTVVFTPLAEMVAINLLKQPRSKMNLGGAGNGLIGYTPEHGVTMGLPMPHPILGRGGSLASAGMGFNLLSGRF